jgi:hypothetical protein
MSALFVMTVAGWRLSARTSRIERVTWSLRSSGW